MATPRLTPREKALRRIAREYWKAQVEGADPSRFADAIEAHDALPVSDEELAGCPSDCSYCSQFPWWRGPSTTPLGAPT